MWFVSRVGYKGDRKARIKNTERFYLHVAEDHHAAKQQLLQFATDTEIRESGLIRPLPVVATTNGQPNKLFKVNAQIHGAGGKWKSHILSAADADDAVRRIAKYVNSAKPITKANASEITGVIKLSQPDIKAAVFGK